ncbi:protein STICHEL-like 2 isoform X2 [Punica granatum]|uniref:Protein STICHEL-like 2 isoform X2 n=1 Tax=Punica granatum TaxID=22663 RepID=A0A6P8EM39_PUNGR|nr:protein STICHEL-like 2 isoform X2 [Punica granatum]
MASKAAELPFPNRVPKTPAASYGGRILLEDFSDKARKNRRRSLSSVSGYLENPSREYSLSLEQLHRSSSLSRLAETPEGKERNRSRGWTIPWRWSRMRKAYRRKMGKAARRRSSDQFNQRFLESSLAVEPTFSSENLSREEIGMVIKDRISVSGSIDSSLTGIGGHDGEDTNSGTSLSLKYQPKVFEDIVGHEIIVKAIATAIQRKRISSLYLFHGPSGTGKSSTARILAMALNCESNSPTRPCWSCRGCSRSLCVMEMCSGSRFPGFEKAKTLIQSTSFTQALPGLKVFILEECHLLTVEAWDELLSIAEGPNGSTIVFVLITMGAEGLPSSISSRCQKYCFLKLRDEDIKRKLTRIAIGEGIRLEREALELIIAKAEGSLTEAENILDQLTLLDRRITTSMVQQIVHLIPRENLNHLLIAALSGDTMKTIQLTAELIGSGAEPQALTSQLASLIKDHLSTAAITTPGSSSTASGKAKVQLRSISQQIYVSVLILMCHFYNNVISEKFAVKGHPEKLCYALKVLVELEKQPRSFIDQSTQIFAALLQIASPDAPQRTSRRNYIAKDMPLPTVEGDEVNSESLEVKQQSITHKRFSFHHSHKTSKEENNNYKVTMMTEESNKLRGKATERGPESSCIANIEQIWLNMVDSIQNRDIKEFLSHQVNLASLTISSGNAIVHLMFRTPEDKMKAQLSEESISRALQSAIGCPVTVNMSIQPIDLTLIEQDADSIPKRHPAECSHSRKQRAPVHQNNIHSTTSGVGRMTHLKGCQVPSPQSGPTELAGYNSLRGERKPFVSAQEKLSISELASSEKQVDISAYQETNGLPPSARTHALRIKNPKHRWLSLSSIPQSDASVEAYSQDILFEHANKDRENKARRDPKLQKHFSKVQEEHHPQVDPRTEGRDRSWSCKDILCQQKRKGKQR